MNAPPVKSIDSGRPEASDRRNVPRNGHLVTGDRSAHVHLITLDCTVGIDEHLLKRSHICPKGGLVVGAAPEILPDDRRHPSLGKPPKIFDHQRFSHPPFTALLTLVVKVLEYALHRRSFPNTAVVPL